MRNQKGQATVELAMSLAVLMLIIFGIIDFGRVFHAYLTLDNAGREAARAASVGKNDESIRTAAINSIASLDKSKMTMEISPSQAQRKRGVYTTVTLHYSIDITTPLIAKIIPNPFLINNKTVMRVE